MEQQVSKIKKNICRKVHQNGLQSLVVREFRPVDKEEVQRIYCEGFMEMIPDTAFRGLRHHPERLLLYAAMTVLCFVITMCWWVIALLPAIVLGCRYFYSRRVFHGYLEQVMSKDMGDIERFYSKSPDSCLWVAVLEGKVVGLVAAVGQQRPRRAVELQRMSVDRRYRRYGVAFELGLKVQDFAAAHGYSTVVLGTIAYTPAPHRLYQSLGYCCVGVTNGYATPGAGMSLMERLFYKVRHHSYSLDVQNNKLSQH
ncbi:N-acetylaspartate synthetase-like [Paralichthys olivaceus]|uniref:N-acetylaspartate synthetase-like n=1 Tax=Paralichthys olivaceus TaxID=8255 RepID=UPI0037514A3A